MTLSGIQPTGQMHLGNYLGAVENWARVQDDGGEALFSIVDLHALTVPQDAAGLADACRETAAAMLACGIDPDRSSVFLQSHVPEHTELAWLLACVARYSWLGRMTQFKDKSAARGGAENVSAGLFTYPLLMAADMLVYRATHVPVGDDQTQHLELARRCAAHFNREFGADGFFPEPEAQSTTATRVMGLRDATSKMSKSDANDQSRINLVDTADDIAHKIRRAKMDGTVGLSVDREGRPEVTNLLTIFAALDGVPVEAAAERYAAATNVDFKRDLTELLVSRVVPIGEEIRRLLGDPAHIDAVLERGRRRASEVAGETMRLARQHVGLVPPGGAAARR